MAFFVYMCKFCPLWEHIFWRKMAFIVGMVVLRNIFRRNELNKLRILSIS